MAYNMEGYVGPIVNVIVPVHCKIQGSLFFSRFILHSFTIVAIRNDYWYYHDLIFGAMMLSFTIVVLYLLAFSLFFQVKVWFQNRRMKWKRVKGAQMAKDKVTGQLKPVTTSPPPHLSEEDMDTLKDTPRLT